MAKPIDAAPRTIGTLTAGLLAREHHPDTAVLSVRGEVDLGTAASLREVLLPVLEHQAGPVVVDLSEVTFMDSTGVHFLVGALRELQRQNRPLAVVCREGGQVHRLLALLGLLDRLTVHRTRESAVTGSDDRLRPEPGENSRLPDTRAPAQSRLSARHITEC